MRALRTLLVLVRACVVLVGALSSLQARAQAAAVLSPVSFNLGTDDAEVRRVLDDAMRALLEDGYVPVSAAATCPDTPACVVDVAARSQADIVVALRVWRDGTPDRFAELDLRILDAQGRPLSQERASLGTRTVARDLDRVLKKALRPAQYIGSLDVRGVTPGDVLLVDGLQVQGTSTTLFAGPHRVTVLRADGARLLRDVEVPFRGLAVLDVFEVAQPVAATSLLAAGARDDVTPRVLAGLPSWPVLASASLGTGSLVAAGAWALWRVVVDGAARAADVRAVRDGSLDARLDPGGNGWQGYGPDERLAQIPTALVRIDARDAAGAADGAIYVGGLVVGAVGLWGAWWLATEHDTPIPAPAP